MIAVEGLRFTYRDNPTPTLHDLAFDVGDGEILGFLGPSGSGKSTTQKVLYGLLQDYEGSVRVMDREIRDWDATLYERIGICFELPNHYPNLTAAENLAYFGTLYRESRDPLEVLGQVGLADDANKRGSDFSKGMKVRLNVARSILHDPQLLFLDEPTSGLDPVNARRIKDLVLQLREQGTTVFLTTHDMVVADELCDRVAFITGGRIDTVDAPDALKRRFGRRALEVEHGSGGDVQTSTFDLDRLGDDEGFLTLLRSGRRLETVHSQETTLERVFIEVTGEELSP